MGHPEDWERDCWKALAWGVGVYLVGAILMGGTALIVAILIGQ